MPALGVRYGFFSSPKRRFFWIIKYLFLRLFAAPKRRYWKLKSFKNRFLFFISLETGIERGEATNWNWTRFLPAWANIIKYASISIDDWSSLISIPMLRIIETSIQDGVNDSKNFPRFRFYWIVQIHCYTTTRINSLKLNDFVNLFFIERPFSYQFNNLDICFINRCNRTVKSAIYCL